MKIHGKEINNLANRILWLAFVLALLASVHHIAYAFGRLEFYPVLGWLPALAIDGGLAAMAYGIQQNKKAKRKTWPLWFGVVLFVSISAIANYLHAVAVDASVLWWQALVFSASLPVLVVFLGEIVSNEDIVLAKEAEKLARKEAPKPERITPSTGPALPKMETNGKQVSQKEENKRKLAAILESGEERTDTQLAEMLEVSPRTVRTYRAELATNGHRPR